MSLWGHRPSSDASRSVARTEVTRRASTGRRGDKSLKLSYKHRITLSPIIKDPDALARLLYEFDSPLSLSLTVTCGDCRTCGLWRASSKYSDTFVPEILREILPRLRHGYGLLLWKWLRDEYAHTALGERCRCKPSCSMQQRGGA